jgi:putative ABC transport system permease protein
VLLRPLPYLQPDRLVQINQTDPGTSGAVYYRDLEEWRIQASMLEQMVGWFTSSSRLLGVNDPERIQTVRAERSLFDLLGVRPILGRTLRADDPMNVVVIGESLWKRRFGADRKVLGRTLLLEQESYTVIGVMPESFQFPYRESPSEAWIPWQPVISASNRNPRINNVIARLKPGVTLATAHVEMSVLASRQAAQHPDTNRERGVLITPFSEIITGRVRPALLTLLGAVGLVLLIACANVANLLLVRASARAHEFAVRAALGAGRNRLIRQLLTESILLSFLGGIAGLLVAMLTQLLVVNLAANALPRSSDIRFDWRVFSFLLVVSLATGIAFGLLPALVGSRASIQETLNLSGASRVVGQPTRGWSGARVRDGLVIVEIAVAFVLLVAACLVLRNFLYLAATPTGLVAERVLTLRLSAPLNEHPGPGGYGRYLQELEKRVAAIPGVRADGFIQFLPLQNWGWSGRFQIEGHPQPPERAPESELRYVSQGYFETLRIPLRKGRFFTDRDTAQSPLVIIVNESLARRYFSNEDPVGRKTDRGMVIGVVGDVRTSHLDRPATPEIYSFFVQNAALLPDAGLSLVVSGQSGLDGKAWSAALGKSIRDIIHQVNPREVVYDTRTMDQVIAGSISDKRLYLWLIGGFAALSVVLSATGVYSVIAYLAMERRSEFGLRMALGATPSQILGGVLRYGAGLSATGIAVGGAGSFAATRLLRSLLEGADSTDSWTLTGVGFMLLVISVAASLVPAYRAMQVDPNVALRYE